MSWLACRMAPLCQRDGTLKAVRILSTTPRSSCTTRHDHPLEAFAWL